MNSDLRHFLGRFVLFAACIFICGFVGAQTPAQDTSFRKIRFGGYGEILYQRMDYGPNRYLGANGSPSDKRAYISIPRTIFAFDYKFRNDIILGTEVEFEYGGTGAAMELEYEEAGEYEVEVEKGGEVVLEQFHITKSFGKAFNLRAGHIIVPVGITNAHHEPIFFFGTVRPEGELSMLPCTWHETGLALLGAFNFGLQYEVMVVNGLDPNGFSRAEWVKNGRQTIFEQAVMTSPAFAGRLEYSGIKHVRIGASGYYNQSAKNASKPEKMSAVKGNVSILSADAQYTGNNIIARANVIYGNLTDSKRISAINRTISKNTGFPRTDVAKNALTYSAEAGYNIFSLFDCKGKLYPFVRYEYYNTQEGVETGMTIDPRYKRELWTVGLNYFILPNLVVKADYAMRSIDRGHYNNENTFGISIGYLGWFIKK
jgi:hypothetical protein